MKTYNFKKPYTSKMLDISTGHISKNDIDLLNKTATDPETPVIVYPYKEGYFVHVSDYEYMDKALKSYGFSDEFIHIYKNSGSCNFIRFDADGIEYEDLPIFDWS